MTWIKTPESSNVVRFAYDSCRNQLAVEFQNEALYHYHAVPPEVFERLRQAPSKGKFLAAHVKGVYRYTRVTGHALSECRIP